MKLKITLACLFLGAIYMIAQNNIAEEVAWVVGDEPIYKSEIEEQYMQMQYEKDPINGNPYCFIPEQLAVQKLYLHQAKIDTVKVQESMIVQQADARINYFIANLGSKEKVEEYFRKSMSELKEKMTDMIRDQYIIQEVQRSLTKNVKATPADVRKYFSSLSADSIPYVPKEVEVQILTVNPVIPQQEIDDVKARLRDYAAKVTSGESDFSTLAILYSEDPGSSVYGGEIGFKGRAELDPEYASVAFNLSDPKKVSKIVETEYGYHIIQLIEKRGDRINTRHILLKPKVADKDLKDAVARLDSVRRDIKAKKFTFEDATMYISQDKDTKNNRGIMVNSKNGTTKFEMADLPQDIAKIVDKLDVDSISQPFIMVDKRNKEIVAIAKLSKRIDGHKANLSEDYQLLKNMYENDRKAKILDEWIRKKQKETYVRIEDGWRNCDFKYDGWLKKN
ncbi:MAG: peptidylprolyl isomerase [Muribaculaceae bacterium]|nr:peptidylprolyl isomerase [Muribaculaceae bacterium]